MDCRTANLLIEAYHDDELELVEAAHLLAHFEECPSCHEHCDEAGRLRETLKTCRPVDRCPEELARRLARRLDTPPGARPRRSFPRSVTIVVLAGCGLAAGWAVVRFRMPAASVAASALAVRRVDGELVCLRCAIGNALPAVGIRLAHTPHRPLLLTPDGRLFVVRSEEALRPRLDADDPVNRQVSVMASLDDSSGVADVREVLPRSASTSAVVAR